MFNATDFRNYILTPALSSLQLYSEDAMELLFFTCAVESKGGTYLKQINHTAMGIYQCEPNTHTDIWQNFLFHRPHLINILGLNFNINRIPELERLITDLKYATAIARLHYYRVPEKLPASNDAEAIYQYYKKYYNTVKGKSVKSKSMKLYTEFYHNT